ncbi:hypothetical protein GJ496_009752 [Pomphorhynchus laevis]|nr:hypothetical protein GJ496_009752 [Pomphorhynchus laevis]
MVQRCCCKKKLERIMKTSTKSFAILLRNQVCLLKKLAIQNRSKLIITSLLNEMDTLLVKDRSSIVTDSINNILQLVISQHTVCVFSGIQYYEKFPHNEMFRGVTLYVAFS